ncbi:hypothetical protein [Rhodopirellula sallentina]|nr:hypothetical protein [Rhodopirellula sallentina]
MYPRRSFVAVLLATLGATIAMADQDMTLTYVSVPESGQASIKTASLKTLEFQGPRLVVGDGDASEKVDLRNVIQLEFGSACSELNDAWAYLRTGNAEMSASRANAFLVKTLKNRAPLDRKIFDLQPLSKYYFRSYVEGLYILFISRLIEDISRKVDIITNQRRAKSGDGTSSEDADGNGFPVDGQSELLNDRTPLANSFLGTDSRTSGSSPAPIIQLIYFDHIRLKIGIREFGKQLEGQPQSNGYVSQESILNILGDSESSRAFVQSMLESPGVTASSSKGLRVEQWSKCLDELKEKIASQALSDMRAGVKTDPPNPDNFYKILKALVSLYPDAIHAPLAKNCIIQFEVMVEPAFTKSKDGGSFDQSSLIWSPLFGKRFPVDAVWRLHDQVIDMERWRVSKRCWLEWTSKKDPGREKQITLASEGTDDFASLARFVSESNKFAGNDNRMWAVKALEDAVTAFEVLGKPRGEFKKILPNYSPSKWAQETKNLYGDDSIKLDRITTPSALAYAPVNVGARQVRDELVRLNKLTSAYYRNFKKSESRFNTLAQRNSEIIDRQTKLAGELGKLLSKDALQNAGSAKDELEVIKNYFVAMKADYEQRIEELQFTLNNPSRDVFIVVDGQNYIQSSSPPSIREALRESVTYFRDLEETTNVTLCWNIHPNPKVASSQLGGDDRDDAASTLLKGVELFGRNSTLFSSVHLAFEQMFEWLGNSKATRRGSIVYVYCPVYTTTREDDEWESLWSKDNDFRDRFDKLDCALKVCVLYQASDDSAEAKLPQLEDLTDTRSEQFKYLRSKGVDFDFVVLPVSKSARKNLERDLVNNIKQAIIGR